jgi:hypothetical protein
VACGESKYSWRAAVHYSSNNWAAKSGWERLSSSACQSMRLGQRVAVGSRRRFSTWDADGWEKVLVCGTWMVLQDGGLLQCARNSKYFNCLSLSHRVASCELQRFFLCCNRWFPNVAMRFFLVVATDVFRMVFIFHVLWLIFAMLQCIFYDVAAHNFRCCST